MRQNLTICLVVLTASAFLFAGCATTGSTNAKRSMYVDAHPELPEIMAEAILNGQIMVGMTYDMVQAAWGKPSRSEPVQEEDAVTNWIYGNYFVGGTITNLYFDAEGNLVRYEVNHQPTHANSGSVNGPSDSSVPTTLAGEDGLLSKGGATP